MSDPYSYTDTHGNEVVAKNSVRPSHGIVSIENGDIYLGANVPHDDAPRIVEALTGSKVAAVIYEDELPTPTPLPEEADNLGNVPLLIGDTSFWLDGKPEVYWGYARENIAAARHIEAREAANAEAEREVEALTRDFSQSYMTGDDALISEIARRAYELGARAPKGEEADRPRWADDEGRGEES